MQSGRYDQAHLSSRELERQPRAGSDMNLCSVHRRSEPTPLASLSEVLIVTAETSCQVGRRTENNRATVHCGLKGAGAASQQRAGPEQQFVYPEI